MSPWLILLIFLFITYTVLRMIGHLLQRLRMHFPNTFLSILWGKISKFYRHLLVNLSVGLGIFCVLMTLHHTSWLMNLDDASMDWIMQARQAVIPTVAEKNVPGFILLDIDDNTYRFWGEPLFTPRDRLKLLLDTAIRAEPRLIVVDIDVSQKMPLAGLENITFELHPFDQALKDYLQNYVDDCRANAQNNLEKSCPPIILARGFRSIEENQLPVTRSNFLEQGLTKPDPYIQWASTLFYQSEFDQVVRRWWLWQPACNTQQQPRVIPSVELLAAALTVNGITSTTRTDLATALHPFEPQNCHQESEFSKLNSIQIGELKVSVADAQDIRQRIVYGFPWRTETRLSEDIRYTITDEQGHILLTVFSAKNFAEPHAQLPAKDQIVVIGGSYRESRDTYPTPLGEMPGMLILTNAIHSLLQYQELTPLVTDWWEKFLIEFGFIAFMTWAFMRWESFRAMIFSGLLTILILLPASILLFRYGYWLDFAAPLLGVFLHKLVADFEKLLEELKEKQQSHSTS